LFTRPIPEITEKRGIRVDWAGIIIPERKNRKMTSLPGNLIREKEKAAMVVITITAAAELMEMVRLFKMNRPYGTEFHAPI
jgi:hypothetical protein